MTRRYPGWGFATIAALLVVPSLTLAEQPRPLPGAVELSTPASEGAPRVENASITARALFLHGVKLGQTGQWREAALEFERSAALDERPNTVFNLAMSQEEAHDYLSARVAWVRFLQITPADSGADRKRATEGLSHAVARLTTIALQLKPLTTEVWIDEAVPPSDSEISGSRRFFVTAGMHTLEFRATGYVPVTWNLDATPGTVVEHAVALEPVNPVPPRAPMSKAVPALASRESFPGVVSRTTSAPLPRPELPKTAPGDQPPSSAPTPLLRNPYFWLAAGALLLAGGILAYVELRPGETRAPNVGTGGSTGLQL